MRFDLLLHFTSAYMSQDILTKVIGADNSLIVVNGIGLAKEFLLDKTPDAMDVLFNLFGSLLNYNIGG